MSEDEKIKNSWNKSLDKTRYKAEKVGKKLKRWQVVYNTIARWSEDSVIMAKDRIEKLIKNKTVKKDFTNAARQVQEGTHEQINASSQADFLIRVATGIQISTSGKTFERKAKLKDGSTRTIDYLAEKHRLPTVELLTKPVRAKEIKNVKNKISKNDSQKYVITGHIGSAYCNPSYTEYSQADQVVSRHGSSKGKDGLHYYQLEAQKNSSHQLSLSRRLSKVLDKYQEDGSGILEAYDDDGFHEDSNWVGNYIHSAEEALAVAIVANHTYKKRQTKEKKHRDKYDEPLSISERYTEICTESEANTETFNGFANRALKKDIFEEFADKHDIDTSARSFYKILKSIEKKVQNRGR